MSGGADDALIAAARRARERSYAPYSKFRVGAALMLHEGSITTGVNVENASFGLTVCAERNAIAAAVLAGAKRGDVVAVAIVADADEPTPPCGACRQVLVEFAGPETRIITVNERDGAIRETRLAELLPETFGPDNMPTD